MFIRKDGNHLTKIESEFGCAYDADFKIEDSEEIIGIYGWEDNNFILQFGFLIWTPPKL
jgi:hypothetical protein